MMRINVLPVEMRGDSGLEGDIVMPIEVFQENRGTRVDFSIELVNKMSIWEVLNWLLAHLQWPEREVISGRA